MLSISSVGASAGITELSFFVSSVVFNKIIMKNLGENHLAVYGVASTFLALTACFFYATGSAAQPIVSTNYGAGNTTRVKKTLKISIITAVFISVVFFVVAEIFPTVIVNLYMDATEEVLSIAPGIMRKCFMGLFLVGFSVVSSYYLQASLKRGLASIISALRGIILPVFFALTLPFIFSYDAIWWSIPFGEFITAAVSVCFLISSHKTKNASN
jgi:Na+-driven multidrug efflux pump